MAASARARTSASSPARASASFLARHGGLRRRPGELVDRAGRVVGNHGGHHEFTVGQRRGIGLGGPEPLYVLAKDAESNRVVVGSREELLAERIEVRDAVLHRRGARVDRVRLRYHSRALACRLPGLGPGPHDALELELDEPASGVAPGQTACLLDGDLVVGHGTIHWRSGAGAAATAPRLTPA